MNKEQKRPYVRFFASDWLAGTRGMNAAEVGIYITLIALMYERCEPLPEDHKRLARQCGCSPKVFSATLEILIDEEKITRSESGLWNKRVQKEFDFRATRSEQAQMAGRASASERERRNKELRSLRIKAAREKGTHTDEEWRVLMSACGDKCVNCGSDGPLERDHITPIYQGGSDGIENIQPLCRTCNARKGPDCSDLRPYGWEKLFKNSMKNEPALNDGSSNAQPRARSRHIPDSIFQKAAKAASREIDSKLIQATHDAVCDIAGADPVRSPAWMQTSVTRSWLAEGVLPDTITDAVRAVMAKRDEAPRSPNYFTPAVMEAHARAIPVQSSAETERATRRARLKSLIEHEVWKDEWNEPGQPSPTVEDARAELARMEAA